MRIITRIILIFCFLQCEFLFAQNQLSDFSHISIDKGLPIRYIRDFIFDSGHASWIAAANKLIKYDGHSFEKFEDDILYHQIILKVLPSSESGFWMLCQNTSGERNIFTFDRRKNRFIHYEELVQSAGYPKIESPSAFYRSKFGLNVLVTKAGEIFQIENETVKKVFQTDSGLEIIDLHFSEHNYWLTTKEGISRLNLEFGVDSIIPSENHIRVITIKDEPWLFDPQIGTYPLNEAVPLDGTPHALPIPPELRSLNPTSLRSWNFHWHPDTESLWIYEKNHLFSWNLETGLVIDFSVILDNYTLINTITHITEDHNGQIWIGTDDGLLIYNPIQFAFESYFTFEQTGNQVSLRGIAVTKDRILANSYLGLAAYDFDLASYSFEKPEETNHLLALKFDNGGNLWQGNSKIAKKLTNELIATAEYQFEMPIHHSQSNWDIWDFHQDNAGKIWLGTEEGLGYLDHPSNKIKLVPNPNWQQDPLRRRIYHIYDVNGQFWLGTLTGLHLYDLSTGWIRQQEVECLALLKDIPIVHIYEDVAGVFWLATDGNGLVKWNRTEETIEFFTTQSGLSNNHIHAIYEDSAKGLWLSSNNGIMRFDKDTYSVQHFTLENGLPHIEFNRASHTQDSLGHVYFGGVSGLVRFNPENFLQLYKSYSGKLLVKGIKLLRKSNGRLETKNYNDETLIEIQPDYSGFELEMHLQDYLDGHIYAFTIDDSEDQWIYQTNPKIMVAGLSTGSHQLKIKAQNKFGQWMDQKVIYFKVIPPFYQTLGFWLIMALSFLGIGTLLYKGKTRRIKQLNLQLEEEVKERTLKIERDKVLLEAQARKLEDQELQKAAFYANISHDLRTPMTLIKGPFEHILRKSSDQEITHLAQMGIQNTEITLKLIDQLIELSRKEKPDEQLSTKSLDLAVYLKGLTLSFESLAQTQHVDLSFWSDPEKIPIESDPDLLEKIMYNLLSNAFKYTPNGGNIEVRITCNTNTCNIKVKDSGIGISKKDLPYIFDRYFQTKTSKSVHQGVGIGLSIVKELVDRLDGEIHVESELDEGTVFHINLPLRLTQFGSKSQQDACKVETIINVESYDYETDKFGFDEEPIERIEKIILIIDDIPAIREYIGYNLGPDYRILEADNGEMGLQIAQNQVPDLIICDVKMPQMDGYTFCHLVKEDISTSHIPVILLTAIADMENKIKGLDSGAEDYLYKPFNSKELVLKVQNLLQHHEKLAKYFKTSLVNPGPSSITLQLKPKEQHFLDEVIAKIKLHLNDENFGVLELSELMCMSRKNLHRKIKALTDQSPSLFIRSFRLGEAKKILEKGEYNISEVSFLVGFNSPAYFSKCFQEMYGMSPKEVGKDT